MYNEGKPPEYRIKKCVCVCTHKLVSVKAETILMPCFRNKRVKNIIVNIYRLEYHDKDLNASTFLVRKLLKKYI